MSEDIAERAGKEFMRSQSDRILELLKECDALRAERNELLAALKELLEYVEYQMEAFDHMPVEFASARDAIAKAESR